MCALLLLYVCKITTVSKYQFQLPDDNKNGREFTTPTSSSQEKSFEARHKSLARLQDILLSSKKSAQKFNFYM